MHEMRSELSRLLPAFGIAVGLAFVSGLVLAVTHAASAIAFVLGVVVVLGFGAYSAYVLRSPRGPTSKRPREGHPEKARAEYGAHLGA